MFMTRVSRGLFIKFGLIGISILSACQPIRKNSEETDLKLFGASLKEKNTKAGAGWITEPLKLNKEYVSADEPERHRTYGEIIRKYQNMRKEKNHGVMRGFHAKQLGCARGVFEIEKDIAKELQAGIFIPGKKYDILARYSGGLGLVSADSVPDVKGLAIKLLNVDGPKLIHAMLKEKNLPESRSIDLTMTNVPTFGTKNSKDFMDFAAATVEDKPMQFLFSHPIAAARLLSTVTRKVGDLALEGYSSGGAFRIGENAMKYRAASCSGANQHPPEGPVTENYFHESLQKHLSNEPICYYFYIQLQRDPYKQPIENPQEFWHEKETPSIKLGKIIIENQDLAKNEAICERITFHPWNTIAEHRPLGEVNRSRLFIYHASADERSKDGIFFDPKF
jgi:hypothetical protein